MPYQLTESDLAEVERITRAIMEGMDCVNPSSFERHVKAVLSREMVVAQDEYDAKLADEETHKWEFGQHHISDCRIDWCGRYRGQRRESQ
jgi:hypothetical protein